MKFFTDKIKKSEKKKAKTKSSNKDSQKTLSPKENLQEFGQEKEPSAPAIDEQTISKLKDTISGDEVAKKIIEIISHSKGGILNPMINFEENKISYPLLDEIASGNDIIPKLEDLSSSVGILEKGIYERLPVCPQHPENLATSVRLYCSSCLSNDIKKLHLQEHKACGFITEQDLLVKQSDGSVKCISCKKTIKNPDKEIQKLGRWYECNKCNTKFDNCVVKINCRKFNHDFTVASAEMTDVPYYKIKTDSKSLHGYSYSLLAPLKKILASMELTVDENSTVKGKSGVEHKVSLYGKAENKLILFEIQGAENEIEDSIVNAFMVKVMDIAPTIAIFIAIPSVSESAKSMAETYKISVVSGTDFNLIVENVEKLIRQKMSESQPEMKSFGEQ